MNASPAKSTAREVAALIGSAFIIGASMIVASSIRAPDASAQAIGQKSIAVITSTGWKTTSDEYPPEYEPIIGLWCEGNYPRSHVVIMYRGNAIEYRNEADPVRVLETNDPTYWRRLP